MRLNMGLKPSCRVLLCVGLAITAQAATPPLAAETKVVLLGTGTPNADPDRSGPAIAVVVDDVPYLVDFGPGVVRRAAAAAKAGIAGLAVEKLNRAFLTHLHSDHTIGYADLIFTPWVLERATPLEVYGPEGLRAMTDHVLAAYQEDVKMRLYGLEPANDQGHRVVVHEIADPPRVASPTPATDSAAPTASGGAAATGDPREIYRDERVTVIAFRVPHGSWPTAYGFTFVTKDRRIVISGDTAPTEAVVEQCGGCDLLLHEVYSADKYVTRPAVWQRYHASFHTSTTELAELATRARPKRLVLYHQLFWGTTDEELEAEVRRGFAGEVISGRDLGVY